MSFRLAQTISLFAAVIATGLMAGLFFTFTNAVMPGRPALPWIIAGVVLYVLVLAITGVVNVPLNDQLDRAGPVDQIADLAAVRQRFEATWTTWNAVRTVANIAAFGCLTCALVAQSNT
jgi:uncharacterized membrane protein